MCAHRIHLLRVLHLRALAEAIPTVEATTETTAQAHRTAHTTEAIRLLQEAPHLAAITEAAPHQAQAAVRAVAIAVEAVAQVQEAATAQVRAAIAQAAEVVEAVAAEEDNFQSNHGF